MLRHTFQQLQQGFSLQHLHLLLWFVIAFRARRSAQADRLAAGVLNLPMRRAALPSRGLPRPPALAPRRPVCSVPVAPRSPFPLVSSPCTYQR